MTSVRQQIMEIFKTLPIEMAHIIIIIMEFTGSFKIKKRKFQFLGHDIKYSMLITIRKPILKKNNNWNKVVPIVAETEQSGSNC